MTLMATLRRFFRPTLLAHSAEGELGVRQAGGLFGPRLLIIPRSHCSYQFLPGDYRRPQARKALDLKLRHERPFDDTQSYIRIGTAGASVWSWEGFPAPPGLRPVPESALHISVDGSDLVETMHGVEGQIWRDGHLVASRWWPQTPRAPDWAAFVRSAGQAPAHSDVAQPRRPATQEMPLIDGPLLPWLGSLVQRRGLALIVLILALPAGLDAARWAGSAWRHAHYEEQVNALRETAQPILAARSAAAAAVATVRTQQGVGDDALVLRALTEWNQALSGRDLVIDRINLRGRQLDVRVEGAAIKDGAEIVRTLEALPSWSRVSIQPSDGDAGTIQAILVPFTAPLTAP